MQMKFGRAAAAHDSLPNAAIIFCFTRGGALNTNKQRVRDTREAVCVYARPPRVSLPHGLYCCHAVWPPSGAIVVQLDVSGDCEIKLGFVGFSYMERRDERAEGETENYN